MESLRIEKEIIILCNYEREFKGRNFEQGYDWYGIVYCSANGQCDSNSCPYKAVELK